jgi:glutamine amidotransferase
MCRLLYICSKSEFESKYYLKRFADVSKNSREFQGHGWGCSLWDNGRWRHYKNIIPIWEDDFTRFGNTTRIIAHARSAFRDEGIIIENNMPFFDSNYVFVFNGELRGVKIKVDGRIGAEKIFNFIKRFDHGNICEAISKGADIIKKKSTFIRAMNIIIANSQSAFAYSYFNQDQDYFTMKMKKNCAMSIICSESFSGENDWVDIPNNTLMEIK